jgi:hypothetical protein
MADLKKAMATKQDVKTAEQKATQDVLKLVDKVKMGNRLMQIETRLNINEAHVKAALAAR